MDIQPGHNVTVSATVHGGWLRSESMDGALQRAIEDLNSRGYRVVLMAPDRWGLARQISNAIRSICLLGFSTRAPGMLIIGERGVAGEGDQE